MRGKVLVFWAAVVAAGAAPPALAPVISKSVSHTVELPGELLPFLSVSLHARVAGYVERVAVDRGSLVKKGQLLVEMSAPEMESQIAESESRVQLAESDRVQAEAQLAGTRSTAERLRKASETAGAISGNELFQAGKQLEAAEALLRSREQARRAAEATLQARKQMQSYLRITAPFDGIVTERLIHPGALAGPGADQVLLVVEQLSRLRLVVPVPEEDLDGTVGGALVSFHVPAYPERAYSGRVARVAHALDPKTRSMAIELDVLNRDGRLAPGMYPRVDWPVRMSRPALLVPKTSVVTTTERTFVICDRDGRAQWVDVKKGAAEGDLIAISGDLQAGDRVVRRGTDEIRDGDSLK